MLRVLQQFLFTTLFAVFASQANAMFIQPDWFDPTQPGVGTNRYSYSFNDPVNRFDPGGNQSRTPGRPAGVGPSLPGGARTIADAIAIVGAAAAAGVLGDNGQIGAPGMGWGNGTSGVEVGGNILSSEINPELHEGQQGKHVPGHNNHDPDRSPIAEGIDPGELVGGAAKGDYPQVGTGARGNPIFDFEKIIGTDVNTGRKTPYGTVHSGKKGSHVVPADPDRVEEQMAENEQEQGEENGNE